MFNLHLISLLVINTQTFHFVQCMHSIYCITVLTEKTHITQRLYESHALRNTEIRMLNSKNNSAKNCFIVQFLKLTQTTDRDKWVCFIQYSKQGICIKTFGNFVVIFLKYPYFLLPLPCNMHAKFQGSGFWNKSYTSSFRLFRPFVFSRTFTCQWLGGFLPS